MAYLFCMQNLNEFLEKNFFFLLHSIFYYSYFKYVRKQGQIENAARIDSAKR